MRCIAAITCASALLSSGCATMEAEDVARIAQPNQAPIKAVTSFEEPLQCMDELFNDYGVSGVTVAVSGVPDYTGRIFVGSDIWLQSAITKMSQRSGAFVVTDYNPNQFAPEQGLWLLSNKEGFYIPAYYIRGAISGFANNIADNSGDLAVGTVLKGGGIGRNVAYSTVSVDLTVGNLVKRTLISRAQAGNEVVLQSTSTGAQVGGSFEKYGANIEITASRADGIPQAVRTLVELDAIEILGRLTGAPYWACLGATHEDDSARQARRDIFFNMSPAERVVFAQRRLGRLGYYAGPLNGQISPDFATALGAYLRDQGRSSQTALDFATYELLTQWRRGEGLATTSPAAARPAAVAELPTPAPADPAAVAAAPALQLQLQLIANGRRPGAPVRLALQADRDAFAYCYIQDAAGSVARLFPNRWQPDPLLRGGARIEIPGPQAGFDLLVPAVGAQERIACFASNQELGRALPATVRADDLTPLPVGSLDALAALYQNQAADPNVALVVQEQALAAGP